MSHNFKALTSGAFVAILSAAGALNAQEPDQVTAADLANARPRFDIPPATTKTPRSGLMKSTVQGIDSLQTFDGVYSVFGYDSSGFPRTSWSYTMVGNSPEKGQTTAFGSPVIPVSLLMLNADGSPRYVKGQLLYSDADQYVSKVLHSPIFAKYQYSSSKTPTQFIDAVQRAEFWSQIQGDEEDAAAVAQTESSETSSGRGWHTLLGPEVKAGRLMLLPFGSYQFALNPDGSCCSFVLVDINTFGQLLFPPTYPVDGSTVVGAAELAGDITTKEISSFLFPNTFLYFNGNPKDCCVLGFHSYDFEPGIPENGNLPRLYVLNYSSWISTGIFGDAVGDVTALSHELAEIANDPFVDNLTPWWLAPNGNCQNNLEVGDVVEGLPNATYPIKLHGFNYHPQNEALLPWFEFQPVSSAIDHAYSYPNTGLLTALSPVLKPGCK
jgi:hypothetical protein